MDTFELLDEQSRAWAAGNRTLVETWLQQYPELLQNTDAVLDLIYNEVLCRGEIGECANVDDYLQRFPELADSIRRQFEVHQAMSFTETKKEPGPAAPPVELHAGRYQTTAFHAAGGLGLVYRAIDRELDRVVALKCLKKAAPADSAIGRRFLQEAEITSRLEHPSIVPIHGRGQTDDGRPYYAMRFVEGETFEAATKRLHASPLSPQDRNVEFRRLLRAFVGVCEAVAYAHTQQVVHRDLKPSNIMLGPYGETLVLDWGLAQYASKQPPDAHIRSLDPSDIEPPTDFGNQETPPAELTVEGLAKGSPAFMSPEQSRGNWSHVGPSSDIFSLGSTLYFLLVGRVPFDGTSAREVMEQVQSGKFPTPKSRVAWVPSPLDAICQKAMSQAPADRYVSARALADDIDRWLADEPVTAWTEPAGVRLRRWAKRHRTLVATSLATLVVAMIALSIGSWRLNRFNLRLADANQREIGLRARAESEEKKAQTQSVLATERFHQALEANVVLVKDIQEMLANTPGTREIRESLIREAMKRLEKMVASETQSSDLDRTVVLAHQSLGELYRDMDGNLTKSLEEFRLASQIARAIHQQKPEDQAINMLFFSVLMDLAYAETSAGQFDSAKSALDEAEAQIVADSVRELVDRAILASGRGSMFQAAGDGPNAITQYSAGCEFWRQQAAVSEDGEASRNLAIVLNSLVGVLRDEGKHELALKFCLEEQAIWEGLIATNPGVMEFENQLAILHGDKGSILLKLEKQDQAMESYQTALVFAKRVSSRDPENVMFQTSLANAHGGVGAVLYDIGRIPESNEQLAASSAVFEKIVAMDPGNLAAQTSRSRNLRSESLNLAVQQRFEESEKKLAESIEVCREILKVAPLRTFSRVDLAHSLGDLGLARINRPDSQAEGLLAFDESRLEWERLVATDPKNLLWQANLVNAWYMIAKWRSNLSLPDCDAAIKGGLKAIARINEVGQREPMILDKAGDLRRLSAVNCLEQGRLERGIEILNSEIRNLESISKDHPSEAFVWNDLFSCHLLLADEYKRQENQSSRIEHLKLGIDAARESERLFPNLGRDSTSQTDKTEELAELLVIDSPMESLELLIEAIECYGRMTPEITATPKYQVALMVKNLKLGDLYLDLLDDANGARKYYEAALRCCFRIKSDAGKYDQIAQAFAALCHCKLGDVQLIQADHEAAKSSYSIAGKTLQNGKSLKIEDLAVGKMARERFAAMDSIIQGLPDSIANLERIRQLPETVKQNVMETRAHWLLSEQKFTEAVETIEAIAVVPDEGGMSSVIAARLFGTLVERDPDHAGDYRERAMSLLESAEKQGYFANRSNAVFLQANPRFGSLSDLPRFQELFKSDDRK